MLLPTRPRTPSNVECVPPDPDQCCELECRFLERIWTIFHFNIGRGPGAHVNIGWGPGAQVLNESEKEMHLRGTSGTSIIFCLTIF